jgi:uncharacterized protein YggE
MTTKLATMAVLAAGLLIAAGPAAMRARGAAPEKGDPATVSGMGEAQVKRAPSVLRMHLQLIARGKTLEEALAALKDRREAAVAKLEKLKAKAANVTFSAPALNVDPNAQRRRMEMLVNQRMSRGKKAAKPVQPPAMVTVMLSIDWPLEGDSPEKLFLAAETLRDQVKAADLSGAKETDKLSPEEQEMAEEAAQEINQMGSQDEASQAGQPQVFFVAKLPDQDRQAAMAEAFMKAKGQAGELAKAAGMDLGRLTSLQGGGGGKAEFNQYENYNPMYAQYLQRTMRYAGGLGGHGDEAMAPTPDALEFEFSVNATFRLEPGPK